MKAHALHQESSDPFLRSNGTPGPLPCMPSVGSSVAPDPSRFPPRETLIPFLTGSSFILLALQPDPRKEKASMAPDQALDVLVHICGRNARIAQEQDLFFLLLPEQEADNKQGLLSRITSELKGTLFHAGIFCHPLDGFAPEKALEHACKALAHSRLLGTGVLVSFDAVSLNISGDEAYQEGRIADAIAEYEAALTLDPQNANVLNSLGVCFAVLDAADKALEAFDRSIAADPAEAMAMYNKGLLHEIQGKKDVALSCFQKALILNPLSFESAFHLGRMQMDLNTPLEALPCLEKACELRPENGPALALLAEAFLAAGNLVRAFSLFRKALQRMPRDPAVLSGLGACFDLKGENPDIAATFCEEALHLKPEKALFALRLARIRIRQQRFEEAGILFSQALEKGEILTEEDRNAMEKSLPLTVGCG